MIELLCGVLGGLEVSVRSFLVEGSRRKAVAVRHALLD